MSTKIAKKLKSLPNSPFRAGTDQEVIVEIECGLENICGRF